jgi:hypothetical protein
MASFVSTSAPGCHIGDSRAPWILDRHDFSRKALGLRAGQSCPDLSVDPSSRTLSLINATGAPKAYFVSIRTHRCRGASGELARGAWRDGAGRQRRSVTLVVNVAPHEVVDACTIQCTRAQVRALDIYSDIIDLTPPAQLQPPPPPLLVFGVPLPAGRAHLCSQAAGGGLSHFAHPSTHYAVDLDAPIGTPVLAVGDGCVRALQQEVGAGGGDCSLLFSWNSLTLALDSGPLVEYVLPRSSEPEHTFPPQNLLLLILLLLLLLLSSPFLTWQVHIRQGSARVAVGERVARGQPLCESGDAGFCPTPHLHLEAHADGAADAPSLPIAFEHADAPPCLPIAGCWYDAAGPARAPPPQPDEAADDEESSGSWETVSGGDASDGGG